MVFGFTGRLASIHPYSISGSGVDVNFMTKKV